MKLSSSIKTGFLNDFSAESTMLATLRVNKGDFADPSMFRLKSSCCIQKVNTIKFVKNYNHTSCHEKFDVWKFCLTWAEHPPSPLGSKSRSNLCSKMELHLPNESLNVLKPWTACMSYHQHTMCKVCFFFKEILFTPNRSCTALFSHFIVIKSVCLTDRTEWQI